MTTNRELDEILSEIGREHRSISAPEKIEHVLFAAAGSKKTASAVGRLRFAWNWAAVAILIVAIAIAGSIWQIRKKSEPKHQQARSAPVMQVRAEAALPSTSSVTEKQNVTAKYARTGRASVDHHAGTDRASRGDLSHKQQGWNSLDEFVPLPVSEGLAPAADLSVVRIKLRGSDLQQYGLEAPADGAQIMSAEFVVGEDGLPRAIRIVR